MKIDPQWVEWLACNESRESFMKIINEKILDEYCLDNNISDLAKKYLQFDFVMFYEQIQERLQEITNYKKIKTIDDFVEFVNRKRVKYEN